MYTALFISFQIAPGKLLLVVKSYFIDPILTTCEELPVLDITIDHSMNSDLFAVLFSLPITILPEAKVTVKTRKLKDIDLHTFSGEIIMTVCAST